MFSDRIVRGGEKDDCGIHHHAVHRAGSAADVCALSGIRTRGSMAGERRTQKARAGRESKQLISAVRFGYDIRLIECVQCANHIRNIRAARGFVAGVHGELSQTDIHGVHGQMRVGEVAQRRAA